MTLLTTVVLVLLGALAWFTKKKFDDVEDLKQKMRYMQGRADGFIAGFDAKNRP